MAITVRVKVLRPMQGDKRYERGEFRTLSVADAERLQETGAVRIVSNPRNGDKPKQPKKAKGAKPKAAPRKAAAKKAAAPANKKAPAPDNKASS